MSMDPDILRQALGKRGRKRAAEVSAKTLEQVTAAAAAEAKALRAVEDLTDEQLQMEVARRKGARVATALRALNACSEEEANQAIRGCKHTALAKMKP